MGMHYLPSPARGMDKPAVAGINTHMEAVFFLWNAKKYQISGYQLVPGNYSSLAELGTGCSGNLNPGSLVGVEYQAAAVKSPARGVATPAIWCVDTFNSRLYDDFADICQKRQISGRQLGLCFVRWRQMSPGSGDSVVCTGQAGQCKAQ